MLLDVGYVLDNVDHSFLGEKRVVFLVILAVARMVIWQTRNEGLYEDANFSYRDLWSFPYWDSFGLFMVLSKYLPVSTENIFYMYFSEINGLRTLSGAALRAGSKRLNPTSSGCIRLSHDIAMHKRSF